MEGERDGLEVNCGCLRKREVGEGQRVKRHRFLFDTWMNDESRKSQRARRGIKNQERRGDEEITANANGGKQRLSETDEERFSVDEPRVTSGSMGAACFDISVFDELLQGVLRPFGNHVAFFDPDRSGGIPKLRMHILSERSTR